MASLHSCDAAGFCARFARLQQVRQPSQEVVFGLLKGRVYRLPRTFQLCSFMFPGSSTRALQARNLRASCVSQMLQLIRQGIEFNPRMSFRSASMSSVLADDRGPFRQLGLVSLEVHPLYRKGRSVIRGCHVSLLTSSPCSALDHAERTRRHQRSLNARLHAPAPAGQVEPHSPRKEIWNLLTM